MLLYTGIEKESFDSIYKTLEPKVKKMRHWRAPTRTVNKIRYFNQTGPKRKKRPKNEFLMAMMKIKTGIHMKILGDLFGFSAGKVSRICFTW